MEKEITLSIFFNIDKTYYTICEKRRIGYKLLHLDSTELPIDFDVVHDENDPIISHLQNKLSEIDIKFNRITISLPSEYLFVSQIPGRPDIDEDDLRKLIQMEIRHAYPQFDTKDFSCHVITLSPNLNGQVNVFLGLIPKTINEICMKILSPLNKVVDQVEISQLNALNAFHYNFPEYDNKSVILVGIQHNFVEFNLTINKRTAYFNLSHYDNNSQLGVFIETEIEKLVMEYTKNIDAVFMYGCDLTKSMMESVGKQIEKYDTKVNRINPFRMLSADLPDRIKEFCSRTGHLFAPCIGGNVESYQKKLKII